MQFNSYLYILYFLPVVVLLFFFANRIKPVIGKIVLILASVLFYALGRYNMLIYIGISILFNYAFSVSIRRYKINSKLLVSIPIVINVLLLLYFKYFNFLVINLNQVFGSALSLKDIVLPLGISFYTFQQIAYVVAVSDGRIESPDFIDYLTYILYFPKLLMGPLMDPVDFFEQINDSNRKRINLDNLACGIKMLSYGLFKKTLLADTFSRAVSLIYENLDAASAMDCILLILFYTFEIYFDFSGYTDMAVGASMMMNIDLPINFDSPYKAVSIRDFWKRWHISLTDFLTKYIYIPLGGSRKGHFFTYLNTMIVFLVSGIWHGANWTFILWGVLHGLFSCLDRAFSKMMEKILIPVKWLVTFVIVSVLWLLFSAESIGQWWSILTKAFMMQNRAVSDYVMEAFMIPEGEFAIDILHLSWINESFKGLFMALFIVGSFIICLIPKNNYRTKNKLGAVSLILASIAFIWGVLCLGSVSTFVYYGF